MQILKDRDLKSSILAEPEPLILVSFSENLARKLVAVIDNRHPQGWNLQDTKTTLHLYPTRAIQH